MAVGNLLVSCIQTEILVTSNLLSISVAIIDLPVTLILHSNCTNPVVLFGPENKGIAVGISLLSCVQAEVYAFEVQRPPSWIFHFWLLTSDYHQCNTSGMSAAENVGAAVRSLFPTSAELKKYYMLYAVRKLYSLLPVLSRHIGHLVGAGLVLFSSSCSPVIFRKIHLSISVNPYRLQNGSEKSGLGVLLPPPH